MINQHFGDPVVGLRVEIGDRSTSTDANGTYQLSELSGDINIRFSKVRFDFGTMPVSVSGDTVVDATVGDTWPSEIVNVMFGRVQIDRGLLFKRAPSETGTGEYISGVVVYISPTPFSGELGVIAHEVCHAHQDVDGNLRTWTDSPEGQDFLRLTGWHRNPDGSWNGGEEGNPSGVPDPLEDAAQSCSMYYDPGGVFGRDPLNQGRTEWAQRWFVR